MKEIQGHGVAMITPFKENGSIDYDAIPSIVNHLIAGGVNYLVVLGTTAETATLSREEKTSLVESIIAANSGRLPLVIGLGGNHTAALLEMFDWFDLSAFTAVLSVAPYYNKPNQEGLYQHFKTIANHSPLPVILYNVPSRTGVNIAPETVLRLATDFKNIVGLKEASGDFQQAQTLIKTCPSNFHILSGDDETAIPLTLLGGAGVISVAAGGFPKTFSAGIQAAISKNTEKANQITNQLLPVIDLLFMEGNPAGIKAVSALKHLSTDAVRLPLVKASEGLTDALRPFVAQLD